MSNVTQYSNRVKNPSTNDLVKTNSAGEIEDAGADINDSGTGTTDIWTASKVISYIASVINDIYVKISSGDTTAGYLESKLVGGSNITITKNNAGSNETLTITGTSPTGSTLYLYENTKGSL